MKYPTAPRGGVILVKSMDIPFAEKYLSDRIKIAKGESPKWCRKPEQYQLVRYSRVLDLTKADASSPPDTPGFDYVMTVKRDPRGTVGFVLISDPYSTVDSIVLAKETINYIEKEGGVEDQKNKGSGVKLVDVDNFYYDFFPFPKLRKKPWDLWSPEFHTSKRVRDCGVDPCKYLIAGFEKWPKDLIKSLFKFPEFEAGLEHFQEDKVDRERGLPLPKLVFFLVGKAEQAFWEAAYDDSERSLEAGGIGGVYNLLQRVSSTRLFCTGEPPILSELRLQGRDTFQKVVANFGGGYSLSIIPYIIHSHIEDINRVELYVNGTPGAVAVWRPSRSADYKDASFWSSGLVTQERLAEFLQVVTKHAQDNQLPQNQTTELVQGVVRKINLLGSFLFENRLCSTDTSPKCIGGSNPALL